MDDSERNKWMMVGVLALVLGGVVWSQFGSGPESEETTPVRKKRLAASPPSSGTATRAWPKVELADALRHNPFAALTPREVVAEAPQEAPPQLDPARIAEDALASFQARRVTAVFITHKGPAALLDTELVHEGDVLDGVRVVSIRPDGLIVEPAGSN